MNNLYLRYRTAKARLFCFDGLFELCNAFSNTRMKVFGPKSRLQIWDPQSLLQISHKLGTATAPPLAHIDVSWFTGWWLVNGKDYPVYYGKIKMYETTNQFIIIFTTILEKSIVSAGMVLLLRHRKKM